MFLFPADSALNETTLPKNTKRAKGFLQAGKIFIRNHFYYREQCVGCLKNSVDVPLPGFWAQFSLAFKARFSPPGKIRFCGARF